MHFDYAFPFSELILQRKHTSVPTNKKSKNLGIVAFVHTTDAILMGLVNTWENVTTGRPDKYTEGRATPLLNQSFVNKRESTFLQIFL